MIGDPTAAEITERDAVISRIVESIHQGVTIRLPDFDPAIASPDERFALLAVGMEPDPFGGTVGPYRYQFEGEDDLLHLMVVRQDRGPLDPGEAQSVCSWLLPNVPPALMWFKPGEFSHHFYLGHELVVTE